MINASRMLDTNTISNLIKGNIDAKRRLLGVPMASLCISAITEGELLFGLARRPDARKLHAAVHEFLGRVDVLAWNATVAAIYGTLRARLEASGKNLGAPDLLIGAHALATRSILITNDKAFKMIDSLELEDWT